MEKTKKSVNDTNMGEKTANTYKGSDGLLYCSVCNKPVQHEINFLSVKKVMPIACDCDRKRNKERERRKKSEEIEERRRRCFKDSDMIRCTFSNDDRKNPGISNAMLKYCNAFKKYKSSGQGLILYGGVGTGKSFYAACVANELINKGFNVSMTTLSRLVNELSGNFSGKQEYIDNLNRYDLLIVDDLGVERQTEFMTETIYNIIDSRYRSGLPLLVTTNLTAEEIKKPFSVGNSRIYDRILERCHPVEVTGKSRRRETFKENYPLMKKELGV